MAIVGGGPSGLTAALLLARAGHRVTLYERGSGIGGLWACELNDDGTLLSENSCKVYQSSYRTAPALLKLIGTSWEDQFTARHDLMQHWLRPFLRDCSYKDRAKLTRGFLLHTSGLRDYRTITVADWLEEQEMGEAARSWMRATALGGIAGTLRMSVWELYHRAQSNLGSIVFGADGGLHWNSRPPNSPSGFVAGWQRELERLGVEIRHHTSITAVNTAGEPRSPGLPRGLVLESATGATYAADAVFLALPPPAMSALLMGSGDEVATGFGNDRTQLATLLAESVYEHLGLAWFFDRPLPNDLPLGGHNVRHGWHPILVQHSQYQAHLRPPAVTVVVGSVSVVTDLVHPRLGTRANDHSPKELGRILWEDERRIDPSLPEPVEQTEYGVSSATQIVRHGPLGVKASTAEVYVATSLNGLAPYFTASLESAIQAGAAAAAAFDPSVERLPV